MKILVAAAALAVAIALPAFAPGQQAQAQTSAKEQTTTTHKQTTTTHKQTTTHKRTATHKVKKANTAKRVVRNGSPYSTDPAHDAYVNGTYVGSDPDPRIRWQLKKEYCEESLDGCGY